MKKNKEWLKEEINSESMVYSGNPNMDSYDYGRVSGLNYAFKLIDQLEEPEITEEQAWGAIETYNHQHIAPAYVKVYKNYIQQGILPSEIVKQEKVVIPQFVAEYIEERKGMSEHWFEALDSLAVDFHNNDTNKTGDRIFNWIMANPDLYVEGYRNGYTVETEKLYRVKVDQGPNYLYVESLHLYSDVIKPLDFNYKFSSKEYALKFANRNQAKGVAELVDGEVEEITK